MQNLNLVVLDGFLTDDPSYRDIREGVQFAAFRLATNHDYRDDNGDKVERAQYHNIVVRIAPTVEAMKARIRKGSRVLVNGRLEHRSYRDGKGETQHITEVVVHPYIGHVGFMDGSSNGPKPQDTDA